MVQSPSSLWQLRQQGYTTPVLMLTARSDISTKVRALDLGAGDYLAKPFHLAELLAHVRVLLRRKQVA